MLAPATFSFALGPPITRVFALADGLGGHSSGEVASQFALSKLCASITEMPQISEASIPEGGALVIDFGSTNGTFVDGVRLPANKSTPLKSGAVVRFAANLSVTVIIGGS